MNFELRSAGREDVDALWVVGVIDDFNFLHDGASRLKAIEVNHRRHCFKETIGAHGVVTI